MHSQKWNPFRLGHRSSPAAHLRYAICGLVIIFLAGTMGYRLIEGWSFLDSFYMTVITLTTVGYNEVQQIDVKGKIFTILLIITGVGTVAYLVGIFSRIIIEGELREILGRRRLEKKIQKMKDHYIICGFGRIGKVICLELSTRPLPFVVIEKNLETIEKNDKKDYLYLNGDAALEETLLEAGVKKAKGLVACASSDADNLYITLIARELNNNLFILSRSETEGGDRKLLWAGANKVVSPHHIGGVRMAQAILRPNVLDFIEIATGSQSIELQIEEILIKEGSPLAGVTIQMCDLRQQLGIIIIAVKKSSGSMVFDPSPENAIEPGDVLIVVGEKENLIKLQDKSVFGS